MPLRRFRRLSLRSGLALLLLPALGIIATVNVELTGRDAVEAANAAYDRSLLGAAKSIDANISTASGGLSVELPYRMFEFFELAASGPVNFRVATTDGLVELGSADLPVPPEPLQLGIPVFHDASYFGRPVRVVTYKRKLDSPLADSRAGEVVIQVAESIQSRQEFTSRFVARAAVRDGLVFAVTIGVVALAVTIALRPVSTLAASVRKRRPDDLDPLRSDGLPADIVPLVNAVNQQMERTRTLVAQQRQFLDDASHQLRTHLTTLQLQAGYAQRETDARAIAGALSAMKHELQKAARSTHQLLTLARSDTASIAFEEVDLAQLVRESVVEMLPAAKAKAIDLGIQGEDAVMARADAGLLREALANLVANAIEHAPEGGTVTVYTSCDDVGWSLNVEDNGPGLSAHERDSLGGRFVRGRQAKRHGSGLGLAIARSIAARHGGVLRLEDRAALSGLHAIVWWPRSSVARTAEVPV